jgi:hypothetical protein
VIFLERKDDAMPTASGDEAVVAREGRSATPVRKTLAEAGLAVGKSQLRPRVPIR